jgi:hypothetical protein
MGAAPTSLYIVFKCSPSLARVCWPTSTVPTFLTASHASALGKREASVTFIDLGLNASKVTRLG